MSKNLFIFMGAASLLLVAGCVDMDSDTDLSGRSLVADDETAQDVHDRAILGVPAYTLEDFASRTEAARIADTTSHFHNDSSGVLDFEDLAHTYSYHSMGSHNPYHGVTFHDDLYHHGDVYYGQPRSGRMFLFNGWGSDSLDMSFAEPVMFEGLYVGEPHWETKTFWYEGYLGGVKVGESARITLNRASWAPRWLASNFSQPVDRVVLRRAGYWWSAQWYVIDDITIRPANESPIADAGPDQTVECAGAVTPVTLDGSGSHDPDGSIVDYSWLENGAVIASGVSPTVNLDHDGHSITLTVTDDGGATASDDVFIDIVDTTAPEIDLVLDTATLWAPSHDMRLVASAVGASDACDGDATVTVSVSSNEPVNSNGDGNTEPDWDVVDRGDGSFDVWLRAERSGTGEGRVYTITVTASDSSGNSASASAEVTVPHDQSN